MMVQAYRWSLVRDSSLVHHHYGFYMMEPAESDRSCTLVMDGGLHNGFHSGFTLKIRAHGWSLVHGSPRGFHGDWGSQDGGRYGVSRDHLWFLTNGDHEDGWRYVRGWSWVSSKVSILRVVSYWWYGWWIHRDDRRLLLFLFVLFLLYGVCHRDGRYVVSGDAHLCYLVGDTPQHGVILKNI